MRKTLILGFVIVSMMAIGDRNLQAHYRPEQYLEAEQGLASVVTKLSTYLNVLETTANQVEQLSAQRRDVLKKYRATAAMEIMRHQGMRAWYNRLLLQNLSDQAISLGQMSTIIRLSVKPISNGIYQLEKIGREEESETTRQVYQKAAQAMRSILALYEEAMQLLKAVIRTGR